MRKDLGLHGLYEIIQQGLRLLDFKIRHRFQSIVETVHADLRMIYIYFYYWQGRVQNTSF